MNAGQSIVFGFIAALHAYFFVLESVLWQTPRIRKQFGLSAEQAAQTRTLALNQGVYNLFLAAGSVWAIVHPDAAVARQLGLFFGGCVLVAGLVGAVTVSKRILFFQAVPAGVALILLLTMH